MPVMPIPQDWDGVSWCCSVIEWPDSLDWQAILVGLATTPKFARFWDGRTGSIPDAQAVGLEIFVRNYLECDNMGCLEDLANAINNLALSVSTSIANSGGCGCAGTGGAGLYEAGQATFSDDGDNYPDGYDSRAEYLVAKCALSNYIYQHWADDLAALRGVDTAGKSAAALAIILGVSFLLPIPFVNLLAIAAAVLALTAISLEVFTDGVAELEAWVNGLDICLIYATDSVAVAKANLLDDLDAQTFANDALVKELGRWFITFDALNLLFQAQDTINIEQVTIDKPCDDCAEPGCESGFSIELGTGPSIPAFSTEPFVSQAHSGFQYLQVTSFDAGLPIKFVSISGWSSGNPPDQFRIASNGDGTAGDLYTGDTFPTGQTFDPGEGNLLAFIFSGNGPFEVMLDCATE